MANVTFLLPADKYPKDLPYGNDLDNLCKRLFDALSKMIFSDARGKDSCVIALHVMKTKVPPNGQSGVAIEILPVVVYTAAKSKQVIRCFIARIARIHTG